jgi:enamine deaminase RidA (YjgF/YER057c/UK114 family)
LTGFEKRELEPAFMRKTILDPEAGDELVDDNPAVDQTAYSRGVVVGHQTHDRVYLSGVTPVDTVGEDIGTQTREVLEIIQRYLHSQGGSVEDIVRVRVFVEDAVDTDFGAVHAARRDFFEPDHFPASTLVEIDQLVRGRIEIEAEAIIPESGWETETARLR